MMPAVKISRLIPAPVHPLSLDRTVIDEHLQTLLDPAGVLETPFRRAMQYAVMGPAQRIRPILALRIARLSGQSGTLTLRAACSVEIIHCASLIVDDLPCMDDEQMRRDRPATHVAFGEATALLSAFGLVAIASRGVVEQPCPPAQVSGLISFQCALLRVLDASGLCEGQDLDLKVAATDRDRLRSKVNEMKTVPLFELAAHAGTMFSDPDSSMARSLRAFARDFGRAFQIVDDYLDHEIADLSEVLRSLDQARSHLVAFDPAASELHELIDYLHARSQ
jgi:geranylgeranyl diphosphate synthase, type II